LETNSSSFRRQLAKAAAIACLLTVIVLASLAFAAGWKSLNGMAPAMALSLGINGFGLLLITAGWGIPAAQGMGLMATFIAMLPITGWLFDLPNLHSMGKYDPISAPIAVMSALLGLAIVCARPERSLMIILASLNPAGLLARRLSPLAVGFPFFLVLVFRVLAVVVRHRNHLLPKLF
jgi:hypothetical protein